MSKNNRRLKDLSSEDPRTELGMDVNTVVGRQPDWGLTLLYTR